MCGALPQKKFLFTDMRHIRCGDLEWRTPRGRPLPLVGPPEPSVMARPHPHLMPRGVRLQAQPARKTAPFANGMRLGRVMYEGGAYRSWYLYPSYPRGKGFGCYSNAIPHGVDICYTESRDGHDWGRPRRSPIRTPGQTAFDGFTVFVDPSAPASERYKAVYMAKPADSQRRALWKEYRQVHARHRDIRLDQDYLTCMYGLVSPDGLRWESISDPLMVHKSDTDTSVYYDCGIERYVMYTRFYRQERRWIGRAEAEDFRRWGPVSPLIWPRLDWGMTDDIYTNGRTEYPGLSQYHLMFPMVYHRDTQRSEVRLYSSTDGICWNEPPGGPVLTPGEPGTWDGEFIVGGQSLVPFERDRIAIPYAGYAWPHKYPRWKHVQQATGRAWAWWPKDRLCAVRADAEGEFYTFPVAPAGKTLRLNVRAPEAGEVRVGLVGVRGRSAADCEPITGDHPSVLVRWKGSSSLGVTGRTPLTLQFQLRHADVFSFDFV